ncbi:MAG: hypothetical protein JRJ62_04800 [Deltaproteobacteria bacterium]|nr:hypothetical protein [Deltaproteobacteria bacterium]
MSIPKLTTSDGSTYSVTFTRGHQFPWGYYSDKGNQEIEYTRDGYGIVRKNGDEKKIAKIHIKNETESVATQVNTLFSASYVDFMMNTFRYYPNKDSGNYYTMRLTKPVIINQALDTPVSSRLYEFIIEAKEE